MDNKELLAKIETLKAKRDKINNMMDDMIKLYSDKLKAGMKEADQHTLYGEKMIAFFRPQKSVEVLDWAEVQKFVKAKDAFDILPKKLSASALELRFKAGEKIPGVSVKQSKIFIIQAIRGEAKNGKDETSES